MPTLLLKIAPPQDSKRQQALAATLTTLTASTLGKRADVTAMVIDAVPLSQWTIGGKTPTGATAMLEISITAGTNTADEKARFIAAAFEALEHHLAPGQTLEAASYVIVRELPVTDWGYGGQTQLTRRTVRELIDPAR